MRFTRAEWSDLEAVGDLYDALCEHLSAHGNGPGWRKGVYPTVEDARAGIEDGALYVLKEHGAVVGAMTLRHRPEAGYAKVRWLTEDDYDHIYVIYTLAVHPDFLKRGMGAMLLEQAERLARAEGCRSLRLDVARGNVPAENLYRKCGYQCVGTADLGYAAYGLPWFNLYEKVLK